MGFCKNSFSTSPILVLFRVADRIIHALMPVLYVVITANFVDTTVDIFNGGAERSKIFEPLIFIILLTTYQYIASALVGLAREKMIIKLTGVFRIAIISKRAVLEYRHIEDNDTWDLIERVGGDPAGRISSGFDIVLWMMDLIVRIGAIVLVLATQVLWVAVTILTFSIPSLWLAV